MSVSAHLLAFSQTSTNLFRAGILQSGSPVTQNFITTAAVQPAYDSIVASAGCTGASDTLACLRSVSFEKFNSAVSTTNWSPVIDGGIVPDYPTAQLAKGNFVRVPLLLGGA
jgi:acetylcholinesterase